jgi:hypothetical protein
MRLEIEFPQGEETDGGPDAKQAAHRLQPYLDRSVQSAPNPAIPLSAEWMLG